MNPSLKAYLNPDFDNPAGNGRASILEHVLPPSAAVFMALLVLLAPMIILSAESLFIPLIESIRGILVPEAVALKVDLPWQFYFKLLVFLGLSFLGFFQLIIRIKLSYFQTWTSLFGRPDPLHTDYAPDGQQSMLSALSWSIYRTLVLVGPPVVMTAITVAVGFLELYLFNQWIHLPPMALPILIIVFLFIMMVLSLACSVLIVRSLWGAIISALGDVVVITEPDLPATLVMARCKRIAFSSPWAYGLYVAYLLFWTMLFAETIWLLMTYDVSQLITFQVNFPVIFVLFLMTLIFYLAMNFGKLLVYHDALKRYYSNLPAAFRDRFEPPPSLKLS